VREGILADMSDDAADQGPNAPSDASSTAAGGDQDATELLDVEHLKAIAARAQERAQHQATDAEAPPDAGDLDRTEHFSLDALPPHLRAAALRKAAAGTKPGPPPRAGQPAVDADRTEKLDMEALKAARTALQAEHQTQDDGAPLPPPPKEVAVDDVTARDAAKGAGAPSWLKSSKPVDLGRPQSGVPREVEGERRALDDLELPTLPPLTDKTPLPQRRNALLAGATVVGMLLCGVMVLVLLSLLMSDPAPEPEHATAAPSPPAAADADAAPKRRPLRLWVKADVDNELGLAFVGPLVDALQGEGWSAAVVTGADAKADANDPLLEVLLPVVEKQGDDGKRRLHLECRLRSREPQDLDDELEFAGVAAVPLAGGDAEEDNEDANVTAAQTKGLRQCAQKVARQWGKEKR